MYFSSLSRFLLNSETLLKEKRKALQLKSFKLGCSETRLAERLAPSAARGRPRVGRYGPMEIRGYTFFSRDCGNRPRCRRHAADGSHPPSIRSSVATPARTSPPPRTRPRADSTTLSSMVLVNFTEFRQ